MNEEKKIIWEEQNFDIPFSRPTKLIFRQNEIIFNNSWRTLYRELILYLLKDTKYSEMLLKYKDVKFFGARRALFNSYQVAKEELKEFSLNLNDEYEYINDDLYLYNKLSARNILSRIAKILNILLIDSDDVEIYYISKNTSYEESGDCISDNDEDEYIEVTSYDENEKRYKHFTQISNDYNDIIYPILEFVFDDGNVLYSIREKHKTTYLYKFDEEKKENIDGDNINYINRLIEIVSFKKAVKKTVLYFEEGYIEDDEIVYNEDFRTHINDLYVNYYYANREDLIVAKYDDYINNIKNVLKEDFNGGFRLNDAIELMNFNRYYNAKYNENIVAEDNSDEFYKFLTNKFIEIDDKIYAKEALITDDIQNKVNEFISSIKLNDILIPQIDNDKEYILTLDYFMNATNLSLDIPKEKMKKCIEYGLLDSDDLAISICYQNDDNIYILIAFNDRTIDSNHRIRKTDLRDCIDDVISNYLKLEGTSVSYKEICEKLRYINEVDIEKVVSSRYTNGNSNRVIYDATGFNTAKEAKKYFYIMSFPLNKDECRAINDLLVEKANDGWQPIDLKKCIEKNFSSFSYKISGDDFHDYAIKRCLNIITNSNCSNEYDFGNDNENTINGIDNKIFINSGKGYNTNTENECQDEKDNSSDKNTDYSEIKKDIRAQEDKEKNNDQNSIKVNSVGDALKILAKGIRVDNV